jgi:hypothetical protein
VRADVVEIAAERGQLPAEGAEVAGDLVVAPLALDSGLIVSSAEIGMMTKQARHRVQELERALDARLVGAVATLKTAMVRRFEERARQLLGLLEHRHVGCGLGENATDLAAGGGEARGRDVERRGLLVDAQISGHLGAGVGLLAHGLPRVGSHRRAGALRRKDRLWIRPLARLETQDGPAQQGARHGARRGAAADHAAGGASDGGGMNEPRLLEAIEHGVGGRGHDFCGEQAEDRLGEPAHVGDVLGRVVGHGLDRVGEAHHRHHQGGREIDAARRFERIVEELLRRVEVGGPQGAHEPGPPSRAAGGGGRSGERVAEGGRERRLAGREVACGAA